MGRSPKAPAANRIDPDVEKAIKELLREVTQQPRKGENVTPIPLGDKLAVMKIALELEKLKARLDDSKDGSSFDEPLGPEGDEA